MKSWNLNFLEPSGPLETCNGTAVPDIDYKRTFEEQGNSRTLQCSVILTLESWISRLRGRSANYQTATLGRIWIDCVRTRKQNLADVSE